MQHIEQTVKQLFAKHLNIKQVPMNEKMHDLGLFSEAKINNLRTGLRKHFGTHIPIEPISTVYSVTEFIKRQIPQP